MIHEQMGWDHIDDEDIPTRISELSYQCAYALKLYNVLPDVVEGMSGSWVGKDFSGLGDIMEIYSIPKDPNIFDLLMEAIDETSKIYEEKRKSKK